MNPPHTLAQVRNVVEGTWEEVAHWLSAKPGVFTLPHPEQQIAFEYADRLRRAIRHMVGNHNWDRLYFDATTLSFERAPMPFDGRRTPIYVDTRQIFGVPQQAVRDPAAPDLAVSIQVLRSAPEMLELDDECRPRRQTWMPVSLRSQGWLLEEHVALLQAYAEATCEGYLFVAYSNEARRRSSIDHREVASWASWHRPSDTFWWATRHFRAKARGD
jgi:hypothetical protein